MNVAEDIVQILWRHMKIVKCETGNLCVSIKDNKIKNN